MKEEFIQKGTIVRIVSDYVKSSKTLYSDFINASLRDETQIVTRDVTILALSKYGVGEGNIPIKTSKRNNRLVLYIDENGNEVLSQHSTNEYGVWNAKQYSKRMGSEIGKELPYNIVLNTMGGLREDLPSKLKAFIEENFNSMGNTDKRFRRERFNLILSLQEYDVLPTLQNINFDSIAGLNLQAVADLIINIAIRQEDVSGNKLVIKKSEVESNPFVKMGVMDLILNLSSKEVMNRKNSKEE